MGTQTPNVEWRRSSRCGNGACLAFAADSEAVYVRDLKQDDGPVLWLSHAAWRDFIIGIKGGQFPAPASSNAANRVGDAAY
jgi:hypothetical protein